VVGVIHGLAGTGAVAGNQVTVNWGTTAVAYTITPADITAGLAAVPKEIFEAARLDGATGWRFLWHIVVPSLRHVIEFWGVSLVVWSFTSLFAFIYVMTKGGPGYCTTLVEYHLYFQAFEANRMGYACALGSALFLMVFGLVLLQIRLMAGRED
jgi:multiple sugar transport system permease protein